MNELETWDITNPTTGELITLVRKSAYDALVAQVAALTAENTQLQLIVVDLLDGLDDHWMTTPDGDSAIRRARAALQPPQGSEEK